jgi:molecular chaperone GrpE
MDHVDQDIDAAATGPSLDAQSATDPSAAQPEQLDEVQTLRQELDAARQLAEDNQNKFLRTRADMENYKKRIERTYADLTRTSKKDLLNKLLGVKDNLERALQYGEQGATSGESVLEGVRLTQYQLEQLLTQEGVKQIEAEGQPFDPRLEEALQSVNDPNVPDHTVVQVVRKGYTYQDEVLRPAQVIVSVHEHS